MIRRVRLVNFMSHRDTLIELADGLTVVFGPNNCGKSALVAAIQAVARNDAQNYAIRHDEKEASVTIETDDGHSITWRRKRKGDTGTVIYTVDGKEIPRIPRGGVPEEAEEALRLRRAGVDKDTFEIHFGEQKSPIFLLGDSAAGRRAAQFLGLSSDAGKLLEMQNLHNQQTKERRSEKKLREAELASWDERLDVLKPIDDLGKPVAEVEELHEEILRMDDEILALEEHLAALHRAATEHSHHEDRAATLAALPAPPVLENEVAVERALELLRGAARRTEALAARSEALDPLVAPPEIEEERPLDAAIEAIRRLERMVERVEATTTTLDALETPPDLESENELASVLERLARTSGAEQTLGRRLEAFEALSAVPELEDTRQLEQALEHLRRAQRAVDTEAATAGPLSALEAPPEVDDTDPLAVAIEELRKAEGAADQEGRELEAIARELAQAVKALDDWAAKNPLCPTCGGEVDADRLHEGPGHA